MNNPYVDADEYVGWISMSSERVASVKERAARAFPEAAKLRYAQLLQDWAKTDHGRMPTMEAAEVLVVEEFEVLCRGLGRLAAIDPNYILDFTVGPSGSRDDL